MGKQKTKKAQKRDTLDKETLEYYQRISHELRQDISDEENKGRREKSSFAKYSGTARDGRYSSA